MLGGGAVAAHAILLVLMPPEPLPWDRKDFFRERKHERSESIGSVARWRDSSHHPSRDLNRWGSADFRRPPGQGKQGGWHFFPEESAHGYASSRSSEKVLEDEGCRSSISRGEGKYGRNGRDNRGSYSQREWRGHSWETSNGFSNMPGRAHDLNNEPKSRDEMPSYPSHSNGGFGNTWDQIQLRDQHDKMGGSNGLGTGQKCDRENSLGLNDWKPIKWTRSASLSSRGSGFSHLSSSKSVGAIDSSEAKVESQTKNATPVQSPSGDANACVTSAAPSEETTSRKKPRLGWGEGLAKYEKKKVDGPDVTLNKDGAVFAVSNLEPFHSTSSNKSPRVTSFSDCASPATPSSVACSSSPGVEDKSFGKAANMDNDISNLCGSPGPVSQNHSEGFPFNLEKLDFDSVTNLGPILTELLQLDDPNSMDSSFVRSTAMNKLLLLKAEISKTLEVTESEIDLLENELKSLNSIPRISSPSASSSLPLEDKSKLCEGQDVVTNLIPRPTPLQIVSFRDAVVEEIPICNGDQEEIRVNDKDEDVDSPGTVTSKLVEPLSLAKEVLSFDTLNHVVEEMNHNRMENKEKECSVRSGGGETGLLTYGDDSMRAEGETTAPVSGALDICTVGEDMLHDAILLSNKELAKTAHEVFNKLLPLGDVKLDVCRLSSALSSQHHTLVKEKFAMRKRFLKFKERVITLKFKAFHHLWKEDMRLLSIRKCRAKSLKKFELSLRSVHNGYQKHRSSIRSRFSSPGGNVSLVPTTEIIDFTSKLLSDSQVKLYRNNLKMPALILDKREKLVSRFISNNGLVPDPCAAEKERALINPWTPEEREIFMDKLASLGKDFKKIASFLDHKTTADCVEFYYKNHKSACFQKTKKLDISKQDKSLSNSSYLIPSGKKWNREMNAASLDILGAASVMAANADGGMRSRQTCPGRLILGGGLSKSKASWGDDGTVERLCDFDILGNERETAAADVLAGICGSLSSEAMSSCITSSVDPGEGYREWKSYKVDSVLRRPLTPDDTQNVDDETCSDESCGEMDPTDWTDEEKSIFVQAVSSYGRDFARISQCVRTRSRDQCKVFFSKARKCLGLDLIHPGQGNERTSAGDDANGSGSGSENACALETSSGICSDKSGSKMDKDLQSAMKINHDESEPAETLNLQSAACRSEVENERELLDQKRIDGASESRGSDACQTHGRPNLVSDGDSNITNGAEERSEKLPIRKSELVLVNMDSVMKTVAEQGTYVAESVSVCEGNDPESLNAGTVVGLKPVDEVSSDGPGNKLEELNERGNAITSGKNGLKSVVHDSTIVGNVSNLAAEGRSSSGFNLNPDCSQQVSVELNSRDTSCATSLSQGTSLASANSISVDSGVLEYEQKGNECKMSSTRDFQESRDVSHKPVFRDGLHGHLTGPPLSSNGDSSHAPRAYSLQLPVKKEMNGDVRCRNLSEVQSLPNSDRSSSNHFGPQGCRLQKCNTLKPPCSTSEFPLHNMSQKIEQAIDHTKGHPQSLSDSENPSRNGGDVKLFGKILSNALSVQKVNSNHRENEEREGSHEHNSSNKPSNPKFANPHNSDGNAAVLKLDRNNYLGLENVQMRSYYWDANRLQTAFPSMPDSAILLAKYPAAFGNFPTPSSKMEQQQQHLQAVVKSNERNVNGVSVFPTREISSSNGIVDYQVYRSRDATKVPPFTVDVKPRQDVFSEIQRRNSIEALASYQHQGIGMVGMNVVGRGGGIVVGSGPCTAGVSDPVAALKLHFAKTEQYGGQTSSIIREDESWRGKGDIGR